MTKAHQRQLRIGLPPEWRWESHHRAEYERREAALIEDFFRSLNVNSEVVGLFGRGFPTSMYKVFVRATPGGPWWNLEKGHSTDHCPFETNELRKVADRPSILWTNLLGLLPYQAKSNPFVDRLWARANEVVKLPNRKTASISTL